MNHYIEDFKITFDGPALKENEIDARVLANSLLGLSEVIEDANHIINGKESKVITKVCTSPQPGSFIESILTIMSSSGSEAICNIITLLGFSKGILVEGEATRSIVGTLIDVYRLIKNEKIINEESAGNEYPNCKKITIGNEFTPYINGNNNQMNNTFIVTDQTLKLYKNPKIQQQMSKLMSPLEEEGLDFIHFGKDENNRETITKTDKSYFKAPEKESLEVDHIELKLTVITPDLSGHRKGWKFIYFDSEDKPISIIAEVEDEDFLEDVANGIHSFQNGIIIRAKVKKVQMKKIKRTTTHSIVKVLEVIQPEVEESQ